MRGVTMRLPSSPVEYAGWRDWRAMQANPSRWTVETRRDQCPMCWGQGAIYEPVAVRQSGEGRMAFVNETRTPHYIPVACQACGGRGRVERVVAVEVTR